MTAGRTGHRAVVRGLAAVGLLLALCGCAVVSPQKIPVDRLEYGQVVAESWKRQTLMNVVRLRYGDAPMFLDVSSIINSYSMTQKASANIDLHKSSSSNLLELGVDGTWSNTPTVTYQPLMGARFTNSMLQPIPPASVLRLLQSGWSANLVFRTVLRSVNGLYNVSAGAQGDPRFKDLIATMDRIQGARGIDIRLQPRKDGSAVILVLPGEADAGTSADRLHLVELLGLRPDATELEIVYGHSSRDGAQVAMLTRSMLEIMLELGFSVDLPEANATDGSTLPGRGKPGPAADRLVRIRSGPEAPQDAYAAVNYNGHSFWIDGRDIASKSTFTFMLILFSLAETGQSASAPVVTVPSR